MHRLGSTHGRIDSGSRRPAGATRSISARACRSSRRNASHAGRRKTTAMAPMAVRYGSAAAGMGPPDQSWASWARLPPNSTALATWRATMTYIAPAMGRWNRCQ